MMLLGFSTSNADDNSSANSAARPASSLRRQLIVAAIALACLGGLALCIDLDVARWCKAGHLPREVTRFLNFSEVFGHGIGVATILLATAVLDPTLGGWHARPQCGILPFSWDFARMVVAGFAGGLMANLIKATPLDRVRPRAADLAAAASALSTFGDSVATTIASHSHSDVNSFPSGHAATAAGLAAALSWKYPRGRWFFVAMAVAASAQRVASSAHYPSDVLLGAALGLVGGACVIGLSPPHTTSLTDGSFTNRVTQ